MGRFVDCLVVSREEDSDKGGRAITLSVGVGLIGSSED